MTTITDREHIMMLEADLANARERLRETLAALAAAVSLLERGGKSSKKAAPSDKMFDQMLRDYRVSIRRARALLRKEDGE